MNDPTPTLPASDPAYGDILATLTRHGGMTLAANAATQPLLTDLLEVVIRDRVRQVGPVPDTTAFFDQLTPKQQVEMCVAEDGDDEPQAVAERVEVSPTGVYTATVDYDADHSRTFAPAEVPHYIDTLLMAMTYAEYDAAVLNQLRNVLNRRGTEVEAKRSAHLAMNVVLDLRASRPPIDQAAVRPLLVRAAVGKDTGQPYLNVRIAGTKVTWRWQRPSVIQHVEHLRMVVVAADMDAAYRRLLVGQMGLDDTTARSVVGDLSQWRVEQPER